MMLFNRFMEMNFRRFVRPVCIILTAAVIYSCNNGDSPDVSHINVSIKIGRFEKFLFERLDTNNIEQGIAQLQSAFPHFTNDFVTNILGLPGVNPGLSDSAKAFTLSEITRFIRLTKPIYDSLSRKFSDISDLQKELTQAFTYVKYYFPAYTVPSILTYIGPFDAPAIAITTESLAIGLQLYAGKDFSFYTSMQGQELYPMYISRRFEPQYIPADCMKAVAEDLYPDKSRGRSLIEQMIEKGKQWYMLDLFLPGEPDSLKTGYTQKQLQWCKDNEGLIWNFILQGSDIYTTEPALIKNYIGEAPNTLGMPGSSPGNIGQWIGLNIVQTFASKHPKMTLKDILSTDPVKLFTDARYKPR